jgi:hypothetical protein
MITCLLERGVLRKVVQRAATASPRLCLCLCYHQRCYFTNNCMEQVVKFLRLLWNLKIPYHF